MKKQTKKIPFILLLIIFISCGKDEIKESFEISQISKTKYELTKNEAKSLLLNFLNDDKSFRSGEYIIENESKVHSYFIKRENDKTVTIDTIPIFEFQTLKNGKRGYSLVVGDKRIQKVLISVDQGSLSDTLFIIPLREYVRLIPEFIKQDLRKNRTIELKTRITVENHYCFLPTIWGQDYPYNAQCPISSCSPEKYNGRYPAGCVPIAISQILAYHRKPSDLNWSMILTSPIITSSSPQTVINQVSGLIAQVGNRVKVNYNCTGSGISIGQIPQDINTTFSSYGFVCGQYQSFSITAIINSLSYNRPVLMIGWANQGGHAWVCDAWKRHIYGANEYYYLEMDWGWNGNSNGFYYITNPVGFQTGNYYFSSITMIPDIRAF